MRTGGGPTRSLSHSAASLAGRLASLPAQARSWRARQRISPGWTAAVAGLAAIVALPLATIVVLALTAPDNAWPHLMRTVLPGALRDTALLMLGVGVLCLAFGTGTAWLITMYRFPGRAILDRLLVLPLAMPTYISRLLLCGATRLFRPGAAPAAGDVRLAHGARLLVPRDTHAAGRRSRAVGRSLPVRLPVGAGELRAAVGVRAGGGAHAGSYRGADLLGGGPAVGAAGAGGGRGARLDGVPERSGRRAVSRRADADGERLHHLAAALEVSAGQRRLHWSHCCSCWR